MSKRPTKRKMRRAVQGAIDGTLRVLRAQGRHVVMGFH
jgi:hypothetical protein